MLISETPPLSGANKAVLGAGVWAIFAFATLSDLHGSAWAYALLVFAALVLAPLVLELMVELRDAGRTARWFGWARAGQLPAALLLALACWLRPGVLAACSALPWLAVTVLLAGTGILRAARDGLARPLDRLCTDAALVLLAVGGGWTLLDRGAYQPLGFDDAIVALTAVHFHYAGFLLPTFAGFVLRRVPDSRVAARAAVAVVLGVPAVAVGITVTQLGAGPATEAAAGFVLALAGAVVAIFHVRIALEPGASRIARTLLGVAGASLFFGMVLAALYAMRGFVAVPWLGIPAMRALHGTVLALGFGLCGVLGWQQVFRSAKPS